MNHATLACASVALVLAAACHHAPAAPPPVPEATAQATADSIAAADSAAKAKADSVNQGWTAANLAIGDAVLVVRARYGGRVYVGAGNATKTMTLVVDADAVDDFIKETRAILPPHKAPRSNTPPPVLEEPKSGRTLSFGRHASGAQSMYRFFFSDDRLGGFSMPATLVETKAVLNGLARGAALAREAKPDSARASQTP